MQVEEQHINVQRTARYFTYGNASKQTTDLWFCCHGYGQLARSMIGKFERLDAERHFVVAPEALSRFYWNGFGGKPVASWMTSEDRQHEIMDYVAYLDQLYSQVRAQFDQPLRVNVLGFSQGTATVTRWITQGKVKANNLILWAGPLASDVDWPTAKPMLDKLRLFFVYGTEDQFISEEQAEKHKQAMLTLGISHEVFTFEGTHTVDRQALSDLYSMMMQDTQGKS